MTKSHQRQGHIFSRLAHKAHVPLLLFSLAKAGEAKSEQYVQQINLYPPSFRAYIPLAFSSPIDICSSNSLTIAFFAAIMEVEEKAAASPLSPMGPMES